jgi:anti-sigma factor RsiW
MNHEEASELLGAYALDAVDSDEALLVAAHVEECPLCAAELAELHEVAAKLGNVGGDAPAPLWDRIADQATRPVSEDDDTDLPPRVIVGIREYGQPGRGDDSPPAPQAPRGGRPRVAARVAVAIGAVAAAIVVVLGVQVARLDNRVNNLNALAERQGVSEAAQAALLDPSAQRVVLTESATSGPAMAELVILPSGSAYLVNRRMPSLPTEQTYQLWGIKGASAVSLGLLGNAPGTVPLTIAGHVHGSSFAITAESAGGAVAPTHAPVAQSTTHT